MSYKRSPLFHFEPSRHSSPPSSPSKNKRNPLRKRASTGENLPRNRLQDLFNKNEQRTAHYKIFLGDVDLVAFRDKLFNEMRHPDKLDSLYESVCVSTGHVSDKNASAVLVIDVTISPYKKWMSTGSDIYLHYLLQLRKAKMTIVKTRVESSSLVVDRIAAHNDYSLAKTK